MHPVIIKLMSQYHKRSGTSINLFEIGKAANLKMEDLPYLHRYKPTPRDTNTMCYSHLLGQCTLKNCGQFHVHRGELPDGYCALL